MTSQITLLDYLLTIPVIIYFWVAEHLDRSERCEVGPGRTCFYIIKDMKRQCAWCGKIEILSGDPGKK